MKFYSLMALALLLMAAPQAARSASSFSEDGTFTIYVGGTEVGTEQFSISRSGSGASAVTEARGRVRLALPDGHLQLDSRLRATGDDPTPVEYQVTVNDGSYYRISATIGGGRVRSKTVTADSEQLREYVASNGAVVLDEGVAHHYFLLTRKTHEGRIPEIIPRQNRQVIMTVSNKGKENLEFNGKTVEVSHLLVQGYPYERHLWVDASNRVLKMEIPQQHYVAVLTKISINQ